MKDRADIDRVLDHWFSDGPSQMPDRVVDTVADRIAHQRQRPSWRLLIERGTPLNGTLRIAAALAAVLVIGLVGLRVLGIGGGPSVGAPGGSPTAAPSSASSAPSSAAQSPTSSATVGVAQACDLVTVDEVATALGLSSTVTADPNISGSNGDVNYCIYRSAGAEVLGTSYRKNGGGPVFNAWKSNAGVQPVSGLGDQAIWDPTQKTLFILKGSSLVSIEGGSKPLTILQAVGTFAAGRM